MGSFNALWFLVGLLIPFSASSALAYTHEEVIQKTIPAAGITRLSVRNVTGSVSLQPWDKPEIQIEAKKRVRHELNIISDISSKEPAENYAKKIEIAVETKGNVVEVRTVLPGRREDWDWVEAFFSFDWMFEGFIKGVSVSYAISAPRRMDADLISSNGEVKIGAMEGKANLGTTNGALNADGFKGELKGRSSNGTITLLRMEGTCDAATSNGKINADFFTLKGQGCRLRTSNGSIRVALPESTRVDLNASTSNGTITSEFPLSLLGETSKRHVEAKINGGGIPLELRTSNGSIRIEKGSGKAASAPSASISSGGKANSVRIQYWEDGEQKVKITVPLSLARETLRSLPEEARDEMREKGIEVDRLVNDIMTNLKPGKVVEIEDDDRRVEIEVIVE